MQKVVAISMVKNEADIIESFVRHTLTFADGLLITDHASSDKTWEILRSLQLEGLPIILTKLFQPEHLQAEVMTDLMRRAINDFHADIVLPLDADEFVVSTEPGSPSPREILHGLDPNHVYYYRAKTYLPQSDCTKENQFLLDLPCRRGKIWSTQKAIIGAALAKSHPLCLTQGSHNVYGADGDGTYCVKIPSHPVPFLHLAHFSVRSREQFLSKVASVGLSTAAKYTVNTPFGIYPCLCAKIVKGEAVESCDIHDSEDIDLSSCCPHQQLRYSADVRPDPLRNLLAASLQLAEAYRELEVIQRKKPVSIVIPCMGDPDATKKSLDNAIRQTYPYKEIFVCNFAPEILSAQTLAIPEGAGVHFLQNLPDKDVFSQLDEAAAGDYIAWLLPGDRWLADNLTKLVACMESQDMKFDFLFQNSVQDLAAWHPGLSLPCDDPFLVCRADRLWHFLLQHGKCPVCGISSALVPRQAMQRVHWFRDCFMDGQLLNLFCWRALLSDSNHRHNNIGMLQNCYIERDWDAAPMDAAIYHQLAWYSFVESQQNDFQPQELTEIWQRMRFVHDAMIEATNHRLASDPSSLAQQYRRMMDEIDRKIHA